jgi:hypothetical protein
VGKGAWWIAVEMHKAERAGDTKKNAAPQSGSERAAWAAFLFGPPVES